MVLCISKKTVLQTGQSLFPKVKRLLKHFKNLLLNTDTSEGRLSSQFLPSTAG